MKNFDQIKKHSTTNMELTLEVSNSFGAETEPRHINSAFNKKNNIIEKGQNSKFVVDWEIR